MITIEEQIKAVKREIALRKGVYPKWVASGRMKQEEADLEIARMTQVLRSLDRLQALEQTFKELDAPKQEPLLPGEKIYFNCSALLREQGKPYPRTCLECGLGPCKREPLGGKCRCTTLSMRDACARKCMPWSGSAEMEHGE